MPKRFSIIVMLIITIALVSCAKRNTAYQEDEHLVLDRQLEVVGNPLDITLDNNFLYVALDQGGIARINRENYHQTWITKFWSADGSLTNLGRIKRIAVIPEYNRMFYIETNATDRITIVDTTDPDSLRYIMETIGGTGGVKDLDAFPIPNASDLYTMAYTYCSAGSFKFDRYDGNILNVNSYTVSPGVASGFALTENLILVSAEQRGLFIYDRNNQQLLSELPLPGEAQKVKYSGTVAYVPSRQAGLNIVSMANPAAPVLLSTMNTSGYATQVDIKGDKVAVSSGSGGVYLYDVADPAAPILLQRLTSCGYSNTVKFMGDKLVVGTRDQGILVYKVQ
ncbi:hypothetical protein MASR1M36_04300 [Candidatus Cloacimonadaceae bacterium]